MFCQRYDLFKHKDTETQSFLFFFSVSPCLCVDYSLSVRGIPHLGLCALQVNPLVAALHFEVSFLQRPFSVIVDESQVASFQLHGNGLGLARIQGNLLEVAQADVVGRAACHQVLRVKQYAFLACHASRVGHVYGEGQLIIGGELGGLCLLSGCYMYR